jgi:uncharacterized protein (TIGR03067 family)
MAIVSCPECSKRLKVADTSVGKKVKCSCGKVFVAESKDAAPARAPKSAPEKVLVACSECGAKLKVATTSLGKRMKCPKCTGVFTASAEEAAAPPPGKTATKPTSKPAELNEDGPKAKAPGDDDMEDLFSFAQKDAEQDSEKENRSQDDEEEVRPKAKAKPGKKADPDDEVDEDDAPKAKRKTDKKADSDDAFEDEYTPIPKSKSGQKSAKPPRSGKDDDDADKKPVYPRRTVLNLVVFLLLIVYIAFFALVFLDIVPLGFPKHKGPVVKGKKFVPDQETEEEKKKKEHAADAENKKEAAKLEGTWTVDSAETNGKGLDVWKGEKFTFSDDKATIPFSKGGTFKVDASKDPKWIDIATLDQGTILGIYQIDGDKIKLCTNATKKASKDGKAVEEASERPTQFDSKQTILYVLKREK